MRNDSTSNGPNRVFRPFGGPTGDSTRELRDPWIAAAAMLLVVLVPLLPFLIVAWTISRALRGVRRRVSWE